MPIRRLTTEYESKYSRILWDEATRSNYFQLADERKLRMLRGTTHAPLHWEHEPDVEVIDIMTPEPFEMISITPDLEDIEDDMPPLPRRPKSSRPRTENKITSKLTPEPPVPKKTAWGSPPPRPTSAESGESVTTNTNRENRKTLKEESHKRSKEDPRSHRRSKEDANKGPREESHKRSKEDSRSASSDDEKHEKRAKLPSAIPQSVSPPKPQTPIYRPQSAPNSRPRSRSSFEHVQTKKQPPFAMYGNTTGNGTRQTYNVKPESKEIYSSAIRAKHERERLQLYRKTSEKWRLKQNKFPTNVLNNLPKDIGSWVTEYQGNFKAYAF